MGRRVRRSPPSQSGGSRSPRRRSDSRSRGRMSPREKTEEAFTQVYVAGISRSTTAKDLEEVFEVCGQINEIVMKNKYAFIDFKSHADAVDAVKNLHGKTHHGDTFTVEQSSKYSIN